VVLATGLGAVAAEPAAGEPPDVPSVAAERVLVRPEVMVQVSRTEVLLSGRVRITGRLDPTLAGREVRLQQRQRGQWVDVAGRLVRTDGRCAFTRSGWTDNRRYRYRLRLVPTTVSAGTTSAAVGVAVQRRVTYRVETRGDLVVDRRAFRDRVAEIYADPRGWARGFVRLVRVRSGGSFSIVLAASEVMPRFGPICDTYWSCRTGRYAVINENRWRFGTPVFRRHGGTMAEYRAMVTNHETGHWFGLGHARCPGEGAVAPVMMQQSMGLHGCTPNAWPRPWEADRIR
jgi:hypothetical protein